MAHADRCWKAEESNASRIATKANWVLSVLTAIIGLKFLAIGKEIEEIIRAGFVPNVLFWTFAVAALGLFLLSLTIVLGVVKVDPNRWTLRVDGLGSTASAGLAIDTRLAEKPWRGDEDVVGWYLFKVTYDAALRLQAMNAERAAAVDLAQKLLLFGIGCLLSSIVVYAFVAYW